MSRLILTMAVDFDAPEQAIGLKETVAMELEKYGGVKVLRVDVQEPEQLGMELAQGAKGETVSWKNAR